MKALFLTAVLIGLGGRAQISAHMSWTGFPAAPRSTGAFPGKQEGLTGPATPMELERLRFVGLGGACWYPALLSPESQPLPTPGFNRLLYQPPISGLRRLPGGGPGECPA